MQFDLVVQPTAEPLTLLDARIHLHQGADGDSPLGPQEGDSPVLFDFTPDDSWVLGAIRSARESCELYLGFPLTNGVYRLAFPDFTGRTPEEIARCRYSASYWPFAQPQYLTLPSGFVSLEGIEYLDATNTLVTLAPSGYDFDPVSRIVFNDAPWPALSSRPLAVRILARGAYGIDSPGLPVPESVKQAMKLMIGEWYENRELSIDGRVAEITLGIEYLLRPLRTRLGMA